MPLPARTFLAGYVMSYLKRPNTATTTHFIQHDPCDNEFTAHSAAMTYKPFLVNEDGDQKIPLFLIKLWNIVEDAAYRDVIRWDEVCLIFFS